MGTLAKIRRLHLREGVPIKEIERRTGIARNTIRNRLRKGQISISEDGKKLAAVDGKFRPVFWAVQQ